MARKGVAILREIAIVNNTGGIPAGVKQAMLEELHAELTSLYGASAAKQVEIPLATTSVVAEKKK